MNNTSHCCGVLKTLKIFKNKQIKCRIHGIISLMKSKLQEESYTSKTSFFDGDEIPIYGKENSQKYIFSGKRIKRGLYQTSTGKLINTDCNGALNILRKSKVVDLSILYNRGELDTPKRIRILKSNFLENF